ncbi:dehydrogenase/reductase 12 [Homo sapiens]|uniref:Dehydrogenase/reductase 12 n=1 Tax=Homo sapiens TaxID=9606 RepID=A0A494C138_HUMAN|nr:dehydrogenase/reductase 12 [Homo sapiens]KAI4063400.1 dehydrogenase/reductase 12 [Homo sapiens]
MNLHVKTLSLMTWRSRFLEESFWSLEETAALAKQLPLKSPSEVAQFTWFVEIKPQQKMPGVRSSGRAVTRTFFCTLWTCLIPSKSGNLLKISSRNINSMF